MSFFSNTITGVKAAKSKYYILKDDMELGEALHAVGGGLLAIEEVPSTAQPYIHVSPENVPQAIKTSLDSCKNHCGATRDCIW